MTPLLVLAVLAGCQNDSEIRAVRGSMEVTPALTDLGDVVVGNVVTVDLEVRHTSGQALEVVAADLQNLGGAFYAFDSAQLPLELEVDGTETLTATYAPTASGWHRAELTLVSNGVPSEVTVELRAHGVTGVAGVLPRLLDFGLVEPGDSRTMTVRVTNQGTSALRIAGASFDAAGFSVETTLPAALPEGATVEVDVAYEATDGTATAGTLTFDLGLGVSVPDVRLRANDCENGVPAAYDLDEDGFTSCAGDCDDDDSTVNPGGNEGNLGDRADQDCDGIEDEGTDLYDDDGDGKSEVQGDCNDADDAVGVGVVEDCDNGKGDCDNGIDDNCDGQIDYGSADGDFDGYAEGGADCNDADGTVFPGAPELADGKDNDCDGKKDEGTANGDDDADGKSEAAGDCDDSSAAAHPGASELPDWIDNDCDGKIDEGTVNADDDGDGFSELGGDCDDALASRSPGQRELAGNSVDEDCDVATGP